MGIKFTAIIGPGGNGYLARCPEVDVASQDPKVVEAPSNPKLAVKVLFETASPNEVKQRLWDKVSATSVEVAIACEFACTLRHQGLPNASCS